MREKLIKHIQQHLRLILILLFGVLLACAPGDINTVVRSVQNLDSRALMELALSKSTHYATHPDDFNRDFKQFKAALAQYKKLIGDIWGTSESKVPERKTHVKYTQGYKSRAIIAFEKGLIMVETIDQRQARESLRKAIISTLLAPYDPTGAELYSDKEPKFKGTPYLLGQIKDTEGKNISSQWRANRFARYLVNTKLKTRRADKASDTIYWVQMAMVTQHTNLRADKYKSQVRKQARRFHIESALIYAIMETESSFNPYAVSPIPAYGLMQIVPTSAGRDCYRFLKKEDKIPSKTYLFNTNNNIEMGASYLHILDSKYLKQLKNPLSRQYCVIAAYNTGSGNVLKAFSKNRKSAINAINRMSPAQVFSRLKAKLPYNETRLYIRKVTKAKKKYQ